MADDVQGREHLIARQKAMLNAFAVFATLWPKKFHQTQAATLLSLWVGACEGIDPEEFEPAAQHYCQHQASNFPPKPKDFADYARARQSKREGHTTAQAVDGHPLKGARPFWFERKTPHDGVVQAQAYALVGGGSVGIAEVEMDQLYAGTIAWGWGLAFVKTPLAVA